MMDRAVRVALIVGILIDGFAGVISLAVQPLLPILLDVPVKDPAATLLLGGELLVAAGIYLFVLRDPVRFRPLLWLCALDQTLGVALPALEIARGALPATVKTLGPMPFQLLLVALYVTGAVRPGAKRSATPFMQ
jgi:hypothetical protein